MAEYLEHRPTCAGSELGRSGTLQLRCGISPTAVLKDSLLKEAFRFFAVEDVCNEAVSEALVRDTVFATEERALFDKDLEAFDFSTSAASS